MKKFIFIYGFLSVLLFGISAQENKSNVFNPDSIKISEIEPFNYIVIEMTGSYSQQNAAFTALWEESTKQFLNCDEGYFSIYHNSPVNTPENQLKWDVGTKLNSDDDIVEPLKKRKWECKSVAKAIYKGDFGNGLSDAYAKSIAWISQKGYKIYGPGIQRYLDRPQVDANGELFGTVELQFPIAKSK